MNSSAVIKVKATNLALTPAIEEYVQKKVGMLEKFAEHFSRESGRLLYEVEVEKITAHHKYGDVFRAEINFSAGSTFLRAEAEAGDLYAAIDAVKDELQGELRKHKSKEQTIFKRGGTKLKELFRRFYE